MAKSPDSSGCSIGTAPFEHLAGAAVDGDDVALAEGRAHRHQRAGLVVDAQRAGAADAGLAHAARHDRGVAGHAAARGQDAVRGMHAVDVLRAGLDAHQDHLPAERLQLLGLLRGEDDLAGRGARRGGQAAAITSRSAFGSMVGCSSWSSERRVDAGDRLLARDQPLGRHVDGDLQRRLGGALAGARLQHPELAALDGELEVLHVAVVLLEPVGDRDEGREGLRHQLLQRRLVGAGGDARRLGQVLRRADAGDHVLALRVDQELAVERLLAGRGIAREGDAGGRGLAHIAEHHRLHVDGGAPARGDVVQLAVGDGARVHPARKHGADRAPELLLRVLREGLAELFLDLRLVERDDRLPVLGRQLGVELVAALRLLLLQDRLETSWSRPSTTSEYIWMKRR